MIQNFQISSKKKKIRFRLAKKIFLMWVNFQKIIYRSRIVSEEIRLFSSTQYCIVVFYLGVIYVKIETSNATDAETSDNPSIKICSKSDVQSCCSFKPTGLTKNSLKTITRDNINNCRNFNHVGGIGKVTVTSQGTDGWRGEYIKIYKDEAVTYCPITEWVDHNPGETTTTLSCQTTDMKNVVNAMYDDQKLGKKQQSQRGATLI